MMRALKARVAYVAVLSTLAASPGAKALVALCALHLFLVSKGYAPRLAWRLPLVFQGAPFRLTVDSIAHLWSMRDILLDGEYEMDAQDNPDLILDLGANIGVSVAYFALTYPSARVVAVEANPRALALLRENIRQFPAVTLLEAAVAERDGSVEFWVGARDIGASLRRRGLSDERLTVPSVSMPTLAKKAGLGRSRASLLKFDIEGGERWVLPHLERFAFSRVVGELHYDLCGLSRETLGRALRSYEWDERAVTPKRSIICATRRP